MTGTTFFWDTSSHDSTPTSRDNIDVFGCKLTDGNHFYENPTYATKMNAMKGFGVDTFFAYHVLWGNADINAQAAWFLQRIAAVTPWYDDPGITFFVMSDDEPFGYNMRPSIAQVNQFHDYIVAHSPLLIAKRNKAYAPHWSYGSGVRQLRYGWWQSDYGANPAGPYRAVYPGNLSSRWDTEPNMEILQYGSNTIIAGQTTSDASGYRGTLADFKAALGVDDMTPEQANQLQAVYQAVFSGGSSCGMSVPTDPNEPNQQFPKPAANAILPKLSDMLRWQDATEARLTAMENLLDEILAAIAALPSGGSGQIGSGIFSGSLSGSISGGISGTITQNPPPPATT